MVEIDGSKDRGRAFGNCLQNFIASLQVTLGGLPFGNSADEISGQTRLDDLTAGEGSDPTIGAKADYAEHDSECRNQNPIMLDVGSPRAKNAKVIGRAVGIAKPINAGKKAESPATAPAIMPLTTKAMNA